MGVSFHCQVDRPIAPRRSLDDAGVKPEAVVAYSIRRTWRADTHPSIRTTSEQQHPAGPEVERCDPEPERGFPSQVVAKQKFGYKWAKWVTRI
jgi:hypothetical protein